MSRDPPRPPPKLGSGFGSFRSKLSNRLSIRPSSRGGQSTFLPNNQRELAPRSRSSFYASATRSLSSMHLSIPGMPLSPESSIPRASLSLNLYGGKENAPPPYTDITYFASISSPDLVSFLNMSNTETFFPANVQPTYPSRPYQQLEMTYTVRPPPGVPRPSIIPFPSPAMPIPHKREEPISSPFPRRDLVAREEMWRIALRMWTALKYDRYKFIGQSLGDDIWDEMNLEWCFPRLDMGYLLPYKPDLSNTDSAKDALFTLIRKALLPGFSMYIPAARRRELEAMDSTPRSRAHGLRREGEEISRTSPTLGANDTPRARTTDSPERPVEYAVQSVPTFSYGSFLPPSFFTEEKEGATTPRSSSVDPEILHNSPAPDLGLSMQLDERPSDIPMPLETNAPIPTQSAPIRFEPGNISDAAEEVATREESPVEGYSLATASQPLVNNAETGSQSTPVSSRITTRYIVPYIWGYGRPGAGSFAWRLRNICEPTDLPWRVDIRARGARAVPATTTISAGTELQTHHDTNDHTAPPPPNLELMHSPPIDTTGANRGIVPTSPSLTENVVVDPAAVRSDEDTETSGPFLSDHTSSCEIVPVNVNLPVNLVHTSTRSRVRSGPLQLLELRNFSWLNSGEQLNILDTRPEIESPDESVVADVGSEAKEPSYQSRQPSLESSPLWYDSPRDNTFEASGSGIPPSDLLRDAPSQAAPSAPFPLPPNRQQHDSYHFLNYGAEPQISMHFSAREEDLSQNVRRWLDKWDQQHEAKYSSSNPSSQKRTPNNSVEEGAKGENSPLRRRWSTGNRYIRSESATLRDLEKRADAQEYESLRRDNIWMSPHVTITRRMLHSMNFLSVMQEQRSMGGKVTIRQTDDNTPRRPILQFWKTSPTVTPMSARLGAGIESNPRPRSDSNVDAIDPNGYANSPYWQMMLGHVPELRAQWRNFVDIVEPQTTTFESAPESTAVDSSLLPQASGSPSNDESKGKEKESAPLTGQTMLKKKIPLAPLSSLHIQTTTSEQVSFTSAAGPSGSTHSPTPFRRSARPTAGTRRQLHEDPEAMDAVKAFARAFEEYIDRETTSADKVVDIFKNELSKELERMGESDPSDPSSVLASDLIERAGQALADVLPAMTSALPASEEQAPSRQDMAVSTFETLFAAHRESLARNLSSRVTSPSPAHTTADRQELSRVVQPSSPHRGKGKSRLTGRGLARNIRTERMWQQMLGKSAPKTWQLDPSLLDAPDFKYRATEPVMEENMNELTGSISEGVERTPAHDIADMTASSLTETTNAVAGPSYTTGGNYVTADEVDLPEILWAGEESSSIPQETQESPSVPARRSNRAKKGKTKKSRKGKDRA